MRLFAARFVTAILVLVGAPQALAQLISHDSNTIGSVNARHIGQSFVAPSTTDLSRISVRPSGVFAGTLHIYNSANGSGLFDLVGAPAYTQPGVNLAATAAGGALRDVILTTPFPVTAGQSYTFVFEGVGTFFANATNPYPAGEAMTHFSDNFLVPNFDLAFQIWGPAPVSPASIPTVSEWGLIALSCSLAMFGLARIRRRT